MSLQTAWSLSISKSSTAIACHKLWLSCVCFLLGLKETASLLTHTHTGAHPFSHVLHFCFSNNDKHGCISKPSVIKRSKKGLMFSNGWSQLSRLPLVFSQMSTAFAKYAVKNLPPEVFWDLLGWFWKWIIRTLTQNELTHWLAHSWMRCHRKACVYNLTHSAGLSCQAACAGFPLSYPDFNAFISVECIACVDSHYTACCWAVVRLLLLPEAWMF